MSNLRLALSIVLVVTLAVPGFSVSLAQPVASQPTPTVSAASGSMLIVENVGQWPAAARFQVWNSPLGAGTTWLAQDAIWLVVSRQVDKEEVDKQGRALCGDTLVDLPTCLTEGPFHALKLTFPGSNRDVRLEPFSRDSSTVSYFFGDDPAQWRPDVPVWAGARYVDLYPGVDLVLGGTEYGWRLEAAPGTAVEQVRLQVEGASIREMHGNAVHLSVDGWATMISLPFANFPYPAVSASNDNGGWWLTESRIDSAARDSSLSEPLDGLIFSTFLGGTLEDWADGIAVDEDGHSFVVGGTMSADFPTTPGAIDPAHNGSSDVFVIKLNPAGTALVYATFLGGVHSDQGRAVALDDAGNAVVAGYSDGHGFPTTPGAFSTSENGNGSGFVSKLNQTGTSLVYSTYLGGSIPDEILDIALDSTGSAYLTGWTVSPDFPVTPNTFGSAVEGYNAFVAKLDPTGSSLIYGGYLGGTRDDEAGRAIAVNAAGSAYVVGHTDSADFPTTPAAFSPIHSGDVDAFVVKISSDGASLDYSTFLGGSHFEFGHGIAVDALGRAYVTGRTESFDFPVTPGAYDTTFGGPGDGFVARFASSGGSLEYATFVGGSMFDETRSIAVDATGSAYVAGMTYLADFGPGANHAGMVQATSPHAFVALLNPEGNDLALASFLTATSYSSAIAVALDTAGYGYVAGYTQSTDFPTTLGAFDTTHNGEADAFVAKLALDEIRRCCDFNYNNLVDVGDLVAIGELWNQSPGELLHLDPDADGVITIGDIQWVARWWGWPIP